MPSEFVFEPRSPRYGPFLVSGCWCTLAVEIEDEGVDLRTALNAFKTAKQRAMLANHTSVSN